jgi:hypothetical protein
MTNPDVKVQELIADATRPSPRFRPSPRLNPALLRVPRGRLSPTMVAGAFGPHLERARIERSILKRGAAHKCGHLPAIVVAKGFCTP